MRNFFYILLIVIVLNINYASQQQEDFEDDLQINRQRLNRPQGGGGAGGGQRVGNRAGQGQHHGQHAGTGNRAGHGGGGHNGNRFTGQGQHNKIIHNARININNQNHQRHHVGAANQRRRKNPNAPVIRRVQGKNKREKPPKPKQTLTWKPKPRPKGRPPPPKGFSGYRPKGWGKGGHVYNDRGEKVRRKSQMRYEQYMINIFGEDDYEENDILTVEDLNGRTIAAPGEYPHATAIGVEVLPEPDDPTPAPGSEPIIEWKCGGSLIGDHFVITAAHCVNFGGEPPTHVQIGDINLKIKEKNTKAQLIRISEIFVYPFYNQTSYYYDIALLKLATLAKFTRFVRPVRLWSAEDIPYETVFAMGYGATKFGYSPTNILTYLNFTLIGNEECNNNLPDIPESPFGIADSQICAIDRNGTKDTCQGDSGGPLQLNLPGRKRPRYSLIGITSYGLPCGGHTPSVYTRIHSYLDWIEDIVWPDEDEIQAPAA